jgi:DNA modification methylase
MAVRWIATRDLPAATLKRFPGNPRRGDVAAIRESVRRHGQYRAIVVRDPGDGPVILAGNHTCDALQAEGYETARCEIIECTDDEARRINAADNRLGELPDPATGERYDRQALADLLEALDGDYEGTGWEAEDLAALLTETEQLPPGGPGGGDDPPPPPEDPVSAPGDLWVIGPHRLYVGDCTDMTAVETMLAGDQADCMWTDPPYGVEYTGKTNDAFTIRNDGPGDLPALLAGAWAVATAALKPGAPVYIAHPPGPLSWEFAAAFKAAGWQFRQNLVWVKDTMVLGHSDYHYRHEPILYGFTAGGEGRRGRGAEGWYGDNAQTSVFEIPKPGRNGDHPTMKPPELVQRCLANSCPPRGPAYDPFGGSGTTLVAAHRLRRRAAACELDPRYADVILRRLQAEAGVVPERLEPDGSRVPVSFA